MNRDEFFQRILTVSINEASLTGIFHNFTTKLPITVKKILSVVPNGDFIDGGTFCRIMATDEIANASLELHVDFSKHSYLPIFDTGENDFIVFDYQNNQWAKFNIVDEVGFNFTNDLSVLLN